MPLKQSSRRSFLSKFILIIFLLSFSFLAAYLLHSVFLISKIEIVGESNNRQLIGLDLIKGRNLLLLDKTNTEKDLIAKNAFIKSVETIKVFPNKVVIKIINDQPIAILKMDKGFLFLSAEGKVVFKKKDNPNGLTIINFYQNLYYFQYQISEKVDYEEILKTLSYLKTIIDLGMKVDAVDITGVHMVAFNLGEKKIFLSLEKDRQVQEYQLKTIYRQFKIEGKDFESLDLRFDKPVIKLK